MKNFLILSILCFLLAIPALAATKGDCHETAMTQFDMDVCAGDGAKKARAELNKELSDIRARISDRPAKLEMLKVAQDTWETYMRAQINFLYFDNSGSVTPMCDGIMATELIQARVKQLRQWVADNVEGNVCTGGLGPFPH